MDRKIYDELTHDTMSRPKMRCRLRERLIQSLLALSLIAMAWSSVARAQQMPSEAHEEREDRRQEDVVRNMHFADDVLKNKFLVVYLPYQERLFKINHAYRDLIKDYVSAQANGQILSGDQARGFLDKGEKLQREWLENLGRNVTQLKQVLPGGVALQAWILENTLHAATSSQYLNEVPFVVQ